jgi:putative ABC transport system permease protein
MTSWLSTLRARLQRSRPGEDLRAELDMHFELAVQEGVDAGLSAAEAQRRARLALGSSQAVVENMADFELRNTAASVLRDFLHGFRRLHQSPVLSITAILTLAIGIGSNTAIFTLLYGVLLRPLSVPNAHELVNPRVVVPANEPQEAFLPFRMMRYLQEHSRSYTGFSIWVQQSGCARRAGRHSQFSRGGDRFRQCIRGAGSRSLYGAALYVRG